MPLEGGGGAGPAWVRVGQVQRLTRRHAADELNPKEVVVIITRSADRVVVVVVKVV